MTLKLEIAIHIEQMFLKRGYAFVINSPTVRINPEAAEFIEMLQINYIRSRQTNNQPNFGFDDNSDRSFTERLDGVKPYIEEKAPE